MSLYPHQTDQPQSSSPAKQTVSVNNLAVRRMRSTDIDGIMPIESVSFGAYHWSPEGFATEISNKLARYWVLLDTSDAANEKLIGYGGYWHILDEAHITTIAVHPDYRGNSLGEIQLLNLIDDTQGRSIKYITLEVRTSNFAAQQLYYKYAFKCEGIRPKYYQDSNEDALIMTTMNIQSPEFRSIYRGNSEKLEKKLGGLLPKGESLL